MEELVHSTCTGGKLALSLRCKPKPSGHPQGDSPEQRRGWLFGLAPCRWLAKHARLCRHLHVDGHIPGSWTREETCFRPFVTEELVAAGIAAAAGQHKASAGRCTRRAAAAAAAPTAVIAARQAAAAGPSGMVEGQQQGLPLQSLSCSIHSDGSLLCSLAGSMQLTHLRLLLCKRATPAPGSRQALASLTGLKEHDIRPSDGLYRHGFHPPSDFFVYHHMAPALNHLTSLTKLSAPGFILKPQQLPSSLLQVVASRLPGAALRWQGMQGVTRLQLGNRVVREQHLQEGDVLPPRLQQVHLRLSKGLIGIASWQPVLQLAHLTELVLEMTAAVFPGEVHQLRGTPRLALKISCSYVEYDEAGLLQLGQVLLTSFKVYDCKFPAKTTQPWKHLTSLELSDVTLLHQDEIQQLGVQLRGLTALQVLTMRQLDFRNAPRLSVLMADPAAAQQAHLDDRTRFEPLLRVVPELSRLRELVVDSVQLREAAACLTAATQLSKLSLRDACVPSTVKAALQEALQQHGTLVDIGCT